MLQKTTFLTLLVIVLAITLTAINLWLLPLGDGRDELDHLRLIDFYQSQHRLPVLQDDWADTSIEGHQPPLYYVLMAGFFELGISQPESNTRYTTNPFANADYYSKVRYNHASLINDWFGLDEAPIRTWHFLRLVSVLINAAAVWAFWRTARLFFPPRDQIGVPLSLAFLILAPGFLQVIVGLNNNNMLFLFSALATWMLVRVLRLGMTWITTTWLGLSLGLGMLTKLYMFPLLVATPVVYLSVSWSEWRNAIKHLIWIGVLVAVISGWWYVRNWTLYGDPTAAAETENLLHIRRTTPLSIPEIRGLITLWSGKMWLEASSVYMTLTWLRVVSYIVDGLLLIGVGALWRGRAQAVSLPRGGYLVLGVFVPAMLLAVYGASRNLHGDQSPPIMRASLPVLCLFLAAAVMAFVPRRWRRQLASAAILLLAGFAVFFQVKYFLPQYPPLRIIRPSAEAAVHVAHPLNIVFENGARLVGYEITDNFVSPGDQTSIKLCWAAAEDFDNSLNAVFTIQLVLPDYPVAAAIDGYPFSGRYPTVVWKPDTAYCERIPLPVFEDAITPRAYDLRIGLYDPAGSDLNYILPDGTRSHYLVVDKIVVATVTDAHAVSPQASVDDWGTLMDYTLQQQPGKATLTLDWLTRLPTQADYHYFLHALGENGEIVAQIDRPPLDGGFPTRFWHPGVQFTDTITLDVPNEPLHYRFGVYNVQNGQRGLWRKEGVVLGDGLDLTPSTP